ncbi:MAG: hypothetical protein LBM27_05025, partial [Lactobacillaceae bacterium]|nr:hypothetical protein [Lactobacillaceae bacterium]
MDIKIEDLIKNRKGTIAEFLDDQDSVLSVRRITSENDGASILDSITAGFTNSQSSIILNFGDTGIMKFSDKKDSIELNFDEILSVNPYVGVNDANGPWGKDVHYFRIYVLVSKTNGEVIKFSSDGFSHLEEILNTFEKNGIEIIDNQNLLSIPKSIFNDFENQNTDPIPNKFSKEFFDYLVQNTPEK